MWSQCEGLQQQDEVLMLVLVLILEVLTNHIGIDEEDNLGSSVGSFYGMTYEKQSVGSFPENLLKKSMDAEMARSGCGL